MSKLFSLLAIAILMFAAVPMVMAVSTGSGIGVDITPEEFAPLIWMCDSRAVMEDCVEAGRTSDCSAGLIERITNYAFEGEQIHWEVLVMDKNKIEEITEVVGTIGSTQGTGNDIEVECVREDGDADGDALDPSCNARILEEQLTVFDEDTMDYYDCTFTVETPDSMAGEYFITVEAISVDGEAIMAENEYWFLNPVVGITVDGDVSFMDVRPGSISYSNTILVGNDAELGSGVMLDMFVSGTDFYDPDSNGARCPTTNHLKLSQDLRSQASLGAGLVAGATDATECDVDTWINDPTNVEQGIDNHDHICYFATSGAYSTDTSSNADAEGYVPIVYSDIFSRDFYNDAELVNSDIMVDALGLYHAGNVLSPGAEAAVTFKLGLPEPCVGNFNAGDIFFWGEAI